MLEWLDGTVRPEWLHDVVEGMDVWCLVWDTAVAFVAAASVADAQTVCLRTPGWAERGTVHGFM